MLLRFPSRPRSGMVSLTSRSRGTIIVPIIVPLNQALGGHILEPQLRIRATSFLALLVCISCTDPELRGSVAQSSDGKTYLAVADDNGGQCGPLLVDGKVWPHPIGQAAPIAPGDHSIQCGSEIAFSIKPGTVYTFDYWGP